MPVESLGGTVCKVFVDDRVHECVVGECLIDGLRVELAHLPVLNTAHQFLL